MKTKIILKELIKFQTNSRKYDNRIKRYISSLFKNFNREIIEIPNTSNRCFAIKLKSNKAIRSPLIFLCHLDTVVPSASWKANPYKAIIKKNKLIGLGASDMKGAVASLIAALLDIGKLERDVTILFTSDEETNVRNIVEIKNKLKFKDSIIISTEPTGGNLIIGQKGILEVRITFFGENLHASCADIDVNKKSNAIYKMTELCSFIKKQEEEFSRRKDKRLGVSTINLGKIEGGSAVNVMADECSMEVSYRLTPNLKAKDIYSIISKEIKRIDQKGRIRILLNGDSFDSRGDKKILKLKKLLIANGENTKYKVGGAWSEVANLSQENTCVIFSLIDDTQAHKANEFVYLNNLFRAYKIFKKVIKLY